MIRFWGTHVWSGVTPDPTTLIEQLDGYSREAFSVALRIVHDVGMAEDVVQEALLSAWVSAASFNPRKGSARTWLLGIVTHRAIDALRRQRTRPHETVAEEDAHLGMHAVASTDQEVVARDQHRRVRAELASLPQPQREAIALSYFNGLSHREIAIHLQLPLGTIKGRIRLAIDRLRLTIPDGSNPHE